MSRLCARLWGLAGGVWLVWGVLAHGDRALLMGVAGIASFCLSELMHLRADMESRDRERLAQLIRVSEHRDVSRPLR